jgi:hypothetical protein
MVITAITIMVTAATDTIITAIPARIKIAATRFDAAFTTYLAAINRPSIDQEV